MTIKTMLAVMAAPAVLGLAVPAAAQDRMGDDPAMTTSPAPMPSAMAVKPDDFVKAAAHSGHFEIESSRLALEKSSSEEVRDFAARMIDQHVAMNRKLKEVASMDVPGEPGPAQRLMIAKLSKKSGDAFDEGYFKGQITGHEMTVSFFEAMAEMGSDPALQEYARMGLPKIKEHLEEAKQIASDMGMSM